MRENYHIGFISSHYIKNKSKSNSETIMLINECVKRFSKLTIIDPRNVYTIFDSNAEKVKIYHENEDISNLDGLIIRSSRKFVKALEVTVNALRKNGCVFLDSASRHNGNEPGKTMTSIERARNGAGITSYFTFSKSQAFNLIKDIDISKENPIICKPVHGRKGQGVSKVVTKKQLKELATEHFQENKYSEIPFFFQNMIDIKEEYRIMILGGKVISSVLKTAQEGEITSNAATGGIFKEKRVPELEEFVLTKVDESGVLGVDAAITKDGRFYIIEANRAPLWSHFEKATNTNIPILIIEHLINKLKSK